MNSAKKKKWFALFYLGKRLKLRRQSVRAIGVDVSENKPSKTEGFADLLTRLMRLAFRRQMRRYVHACCKGDCALWNTAADIEEKFEVERRHVLPLRRRRFANPLNLDIVR